MIRVRLRHLNAASQCWVDWCKSRWIGLLVWPSWCYTLLLAMHNSNDNERSYAEARIVETLWTVLHHTSIRWHRQVHQLIMGLKRTVAAWKCSQGEINREEHSKPNIKLKLNATLNANLFRQVQWRVTTKWTCTYCCCSTCLDYCNSIVTGPQRVQWRLQASAGNNLLHLFLYGSLK